MDRPITSLFSIIAFILGTTQGGDIARDDPGVDGALLDESSPSADDSLSDMYRVRVAHGFTGLLRDRARTLLTLLAGALLMFSPPFLNVTPFALPRRFPAEDADELADNPEEDREDESEEDREEAPGLL